MHIGIITGGGDVPGLNAAVRAAARRAFGYGHTVTGILNGWAGLVDNEMRPITDKTVSGILHKGGTILGTSRVNILKDEAMVKQALGNARAAGIDALIVLGGTDTLQVAHGIHQAGLPVVAIPKTMDNNVWGTDYCIGFDTACTVIADALDRLHTTASSHHRVIIVEVMGRNSGWAAAVGGLSGGADIVLVPERPTTVGKICDRIRHRFEERSRSFSIVVIAEGSKITDLPDPDLGEPDDFGNVRQDRRNVGKRLQQEIESCLDIECRSLVLGHLQRGGSPTVFDRVLATRLGVAAADLVEQGWVGQMVALKENRIAPVQLSQVAGKVKQLDPEYLELMTIFY